MDVFWRYRGLKSRQYLVATALAMLLAARGSVMGVKLEMAAPGNSCPSGYEKVTNQRNCRDAMGILENVMPNEWAGTEDERDWPSGCYHCDDVEDCLDGFWFNSHSSGSANGGARPVCVAKDDGFDSSPTPPPSISGGVLFLGDSDIELWRTDDFIRGSSNAGVGGDTCKDVLRRMDRELDKHQPDWVVLVCGENDIGDGKRAGAAFRQWKRVVKRIKNFGARVLYIGTKPEPSTKNLHKKYRQYDSKIRRYAARDAAKGAEGAPPQVVMIDSYAGFVEEGNSNGLYDSDRLHLSDKGYSLWEAWTNSALSEDASSCIEWRSNECVASK